MDHTHLHMGETGSAAFFQMEAKAFLAKPCFHWENGMGLGNHLELESHHQRTTGVYCGYCYFASCLFVCLF